MAWWLWILFGVGLLVVELLTPGGFYAVFFGLAALVVGLAAAAGFDRAALQWPSFAALGVVFMLALRPRLAALMRRRDTVDRLIGEIAVTLEDLEPGATGRAELRGSPWTARNTSDVALARGQRCRVERISDLTLFLHPE